MLAPTAHIAAALAIPESTIRRYAHDGLIERHGTRSRRLYDALEVAKVRSERRDHDTPTVDPAATP